METVKCIFCLKDKPPSTEHVIPRTLGGNLTIQCVCKECNRDLSHLDQSLADASLLVLPRLVQQPDATWGRSAQLATEEAKQPLEVKMGHKLAPTMKAQLIFSQMEGSDKFEVRGSGESAKQYENFFKVFRKQIARNGLRGIKTLANLDKKEERQSGFRLVLNRSDEVVFRPSSEAATESEFTAMVDLLEKRLDEIEKAILEASKNAKSQRHDQPGVILNMTSDFTRNLRAISKIAYTFLASTYGCEFVMSSELEPLRKYILTGEGADDQGCLWWNGDENEKSLGSSRFALWLKDHKDQPFSFSGPEVHIVTLFSQEDRHGIIIEFYNEISFAIDVGDIGVPLQFPHVHEFNYIKRTNRVIPLKEIIQIFSKNMETAQRKP